MVLAIIKRSVESGESHPEDGLLAEICNCDPGRTSCYVYQQLVGRSISILFCPPLAHPVFESPDLEGVNRRDFVIPNRAESGFWRYLSERYNAEYIVVDSKNYNDNIGKKEVLQIANYLKPHGSGNFAMIFTRHGVDNAGLVTMREQWLISHKMIVVFDDQELMEMLRIKRDGGSSESVIEDKIQQFRLSF